MKTQEEKVVVITATLGDKGAQAAMAALGGVALTTVQRSRPENEVCVRISGGRQELVEAVARVLEGLG